MGKDVKSVGAKAKNTKKGLAQKVTSLKSTKAVIRCTEGLIGHATLPSNAVIRCTGKLPSKPYMAERCGKVAGYTVERALSSVLVSDCAGKKRTYRLCDLLYDFQ